jgi:hypothetical protein
VPYGGRGRSSRSPRDPRSRFSRRWRDDREHFRRASGSPGSVELPRPRDNTVTTNALSTTSRSSIVRDEMCVSAAIGTIEQVARKVEGLVVRLDRGSSNLPGRIFLPCAGPSESVPIGTEGASRHANFPQGVCCQSRFPLRKAAKDDQGTETSICRGFWRWEHHGNARPRRSQVSAEAANDGVVRARCRSGTVGSP